jgi:hypothetical protein
MRVLTRLTNLKELDVDVGQTSGSPSWYPGDNSWHQWGRPKAQALLQAIRAVPSLQRVGVHSASQSFHVNLPDPGGIEVCRTLNVVSEPMWSPSVEEQVDEASRSLSSMLIYFRAITTCPSLHGCSMLRELVLAHCSRGFGGVCQDPFLLVGLEAVAATLTRLVISTDRALTEVHVPEALRLRTLMLVCPGKLALHGNASLVCSGLEEALLGYADLPGNSAELASCLSPRCQVPKWRCSGVNP